MSRKEIVEDVLVLKILAALGNCNPKPHHIRLTENLFLKTNSLHRIFFHSKLSKSEQNCLILAAKGKTIQQTAHLLSVKNSTVTTLRKRTLNKLGCRSMAHAVFVGMHYGCFSQNNQLNSE